MRALIVIFLLLISGYWYFEYLPTHSSLPQEATDHSSLIGKEVPLITISTERRDAPSKGIIIAITAPKISLVGDPRISTIINTTIDERVNLLTKDFIEAITPSAASSTRGINTYALVFTTSTSTERAIAFTFDSSSNFANGRVATTTGSMTFRLDTGALISTEEISSLK